jgi:hypothetical protein
LAAAAVTRSPDLFQIHHDGTIPLWTELDNNSASAAIAASTN